MLTIKQNEYFDLEGLLERLDGDEELAEQMIELYLEDCPEQLTLLEEHLAQKDYKQIGLVAHGLKGASANVGASNIREAAASLELAAKNEEPWSDVTSLYNKIEQAFSNFKELCQ